MRSGEKQGQEEQEVGDVRSVGVLLKQGQQHPKPSPSRAPVWIEVDIAPDIQYEKRPTDQTVGHACDLTCNSDLL